MRSATLLDPARPFARRDLLLGGFTLAMAVVGLASLAAVALAGSGADVRLPGGGGGGRSGSAQPSLVAIGYGEASAPAEFATLQILIGPSSYDGGMMIVPAEDNTEPGAVEREAVAPIVRAMQTSGVATEGIEVVVSPALEAGYFNPTGSEYGVRLDLTVRQPTLEGLNTLVNAAGSAAMESGLGLARVGVGYALADCSALLLRAREAAIADARSSAQQQAELLGAPLGKLLLSSDVPPTTSGGVELDRCGPSLASQETSTPWDAPSSVTVPTFNPTSPAEATARVQVGLTFALEV